MTKNIASRIQSPSVASVRLRPTIQPMIVTTTLQLSDRLGTLKARFGIGRMDYKVTPGIYALGSPNEDSPVLVTANYKLTFDTLRNELSGKDLWILVLDTKGINVWCAAGKGTFGTDELIHRIEVSQLKLFVKHRQIIVPQLGAPGIAAHDVKKATGFNVLYGPVRASDITTYIQNDYKASPSMRKVTFSFWDRLILTPVEIVNAMKKTLMILGILFILNQFLPHPFDRLDLIAYLGAILSGCFWTPLLLPLVPGRAFAWKGWIIGLIWFVLLTYITISSAHVFLSALRFISYGFILPAVSAYYGMTFTGSSTYTSLSGVEKEMRTALPLIIISLILGMLCILIDSLVL